MIYTLKASAVLNTSDRDWFSNYYQISRTKPPALTPLLVHGLPRWVKALLNQTEDYKSQPAEYRYLCLLLSSHNMQWAHGRVCGLITLECACSRQAQFPCMRCISCRLNSDFRLSEYSWRLSWVQLGGRACSRTATRDGVDGAIPARDDVLSSCVRSCSMAVDRAARVRVQWSYFVAPAKRWIIPGSESNLCPSVFASPDSLLKLMTTLQLSF